jgi:endonuclease G
VVLSDSDAGVAPSLADAETSSSLALVNGTFESDLSGWTLEGAKAPIRSTAYSHTGDAALRCGATSGSGQPEPDGSSSATQRFTVPESMEAPQVSFWAFTTTRDTDGDYQEALVLDASGNVIATAFHLLSDARVWTHYTIDLTAYRGQTVELFFNVFSDGQTDPTSLWIDDVEVTDASLVPEPSLDGGTAPTSDGGTWDTDPANAHGPLDEGAQISVHTRLGLPDDATSSTENPNHYLSVKTQYVESYNATYLVSNWVAWELDASWVGTVDRTDDFRQDATLPGALPQASNTDYSYSGYDRGHLCNAQDRSDTLTDMSSTFYLSNMMPQAPNNNRGPWLTLETYERDLADVGKYLYLYAGPIFDASPATIGADHVAVPRATWKVIVVLGDADATSASVTSSTRVIAVIIPNDDALVSASDDWTLYRTSVDEVERQTGLDLLSDVDTSVQQAVEAGVDPGI